MRTKADLKAYGLDHQLLAGRHGEHRFCGTTARRKLDSKTARERLQRWAARLVDRRRLHVPSGNFTPPRYFRLRHDGEPGCRRGRADADVSRLIFADAGIANRVGARPFRQLPCSATAVTGVVLPAAGCTALAFLAGCWVVACVCASASRLAHSTISKLNTSTCGYQIESVRVS